MTSGDTDPALAWAASGAMALSGRSHGRPQVAPGDPAGTVRRSLLGFAQAAQARTGAAPTLPDAGLLGERAAAAGFSARGPWSCGGAFRTLRTADGWIGMSLPRETDIALVPALIESDSPAEAWDAVTSWALRHPSEHVVARTSLLGMACAAIPTAPMPRRSPVLTSRGGRRTRSPERPLVVDLTGLWAGPLCAHLLGLAGATVVKVEGVHRPDGARLGPPAFFDLLHAGHRAVAVDLASAADIAALQSLIDRADLVLESSRPRAWHQAGLDAAAVIANGTSWLSITARGRDSDTIGFGDDVASGAGLVVWDGDEPLPCGDALADPLTGVVAAEAAARALLDDHATLIDVSMHDVAASAAGRVTPHEVVRRGDRWWVTTDTGEAAIASPRARTPSGPAPALGADNDELLR